MHTIFSCNQETGISLFWNDEQLTVESYDKIHKHYFCGKELLRFDNTKTIMYAMIVIDLDEAYCANVYSDSEIVKIFDLSSGVDKKQRSGGQSAPRFARIRDNQITHWFKRLDEYLKKVDQELCVAISPIYKNRFEKHLSTYTKQKITRYDNTEYSGLSGIYQYINKLENEKTCRWPNG